jgi:PPM family protein phosphatase
MNLECSVAFVSHRGDLRTSNEDSLVFDNLIVRGSEEGSVYSLNTCISPPFCLAVADGMGGHQAGEKASALCCESLMGLDVSGDAQLHERIKEINKVIFRESQQDSKLSGMGTTVAGLAFLEEGVLAFNVGDSRVYRVRDQFLEKITKDDTSAQALEDAGVFEQGTVRAKTGHGLLQALGGSNKFMEVTPNTYVCEFRKKAQFLLCTDGLTDMLGQDEMENCLSAESPRTIVDTLFLKAMKAGGRDNVTIVLAEFERVDQATEPS